MVIRGRDLELPAAVEAVDELEVPEVAQDGAAEPPDDPGRAICTSFYA